MNQATFSFNKWNDFRLGCTTIALLTYTYRRTYNELWDCGEYIATAAKLQMGPPPGAPCFK
jgi:hypothetical protein